MLGLLEKWARLIRFWAVLVVIIVSGTALLGYALKIEAMYTFGGMPILPVMSPSTAICLFILGFLELYTVINMSSTAEMLKVVRDAFMRLNDE